MLKKMSVIAILAIMTALGSLTVHGAVMSGSMGFMSLPGWDEVRSGNNDWVTEGIWESSSKTRIFVMLQSEAGKRANSKRPNETFDAWTKRYVERIEKKGCGPIVENKDPLSMNAGTLGSLKFIVIRTAKCKEVAYAAVRMDKGSSDQLWAFFYFFHDDGDYPSRSEVAEALATFDHNVK